MKLFIPLIATAAAAASLLSCSCDRRADAAIDSDPTVQSPPAAPPTADPETNVPERQAYQAETEAQLRERLTDLEYEITQNSATERAGTGKFDKHYEDGIYVCIVSGEALFSSKDKYDSGCGWPAFTKPIDGGEVEEHKDYKFGWDRIEVRGKTGDSHLGHVFTDGPQESGGLRYCINSGSLRFVPKDKLLEEGYGKYASLFEESSK